MSQGYHEIMSLNTSQLTELKRNILQASIDIGCDELTFVWEWVFDLPGQSLEIDGIALHEKYSIPTGWDGYGQDDLEKLVNDGFLSVISQENSQGVYMQEEIIYRINQTKF